MPDPKAEFAAIADELTAHRQGVDHGRMMSSPAMTYDGKVFAFYWANAGDPRMGFRLGRDHDLSSLPTRQWSHLAPFKTKPPMKDWIVVPAAEIHCWREMANLALRAIRADAKRTKKVK